MGTKTWQQLRVAQHVLCVRPSHIDGWWNTFAALVVVVTISALLGIQPVHALEEGAVQGFTGNLEPRTGDYFVIPDLTQGQSLSIYAEAKDGNLDPFVGILDTDLDGEELLTTISEEYERALAQGLDPTSAVHAAADEVFIAWNDDGDVGSAARLTYDVPNDGDYRLFLFGSPGQNTFGDYRLMIGLDASTVTTGLARVTGDEIAELMTKIPVTVVAVDELTGTFGEDKSTTILQLRSLSPGATVYAFVEALSGELKPVLTLQNYRRKPLLTDNYGGESTSAALQYTVPTDTSHLILVVSACCGDDAASGEYRLQVGINAPDVLTGEGQVTDTQAFVSPRPVEVGVKLDQITGVDQVSENFGVVLNMRAEWDDPKLAFDPDDCNCFFQTFTPSSFEKYLADSGVEAWPITTVFNQQGRRDEQGTTIAVLSDGHVTFISRFTATLQAPDFDFRQFPFDKQTFHIRLRTVFPEDFFVYVAHEESTGLGEQLGEEEWQITEWGTSVDTSEGRSRFNFTFQAVRHLDYYLYRIFLPLLIIILVSWAIFFLRNYEKRVDASAANLLLLIAFNFTISGNLPKLGYLTLLDVVLITIFVVTGLVLVINVYLKRIEVAGNRERAERIDKWVLWLYPIVYLVMIVGIGVLFFVQV